jgi:two-component system cell cycle sensor histidine kinase/response regulator CckA
MTCEQAGQGVEKVEPTQQGDKEGRQAREAAGLSEERYRTLVENLNDVIFAVDAQGYFTYISPAIEQVAQYQVEEVIGQPFARFVHPDDLPGLQADFQQTLAGELTPSEFRTLARDGTTLHVRTSSRPVWEEGRLAGIIGIMTDITKRKRAEKALGESEARLHALIDNLPIEFWTMDNSHRYAMQNATSLRHYGDLVGKRVDELGLPAEVVARWTEQDQRALAGETIRQEYRREVAGEERVYESLVAPVTVGEEVVGIVGFALDVTDHKRAEEVLRQSNIDLERRVEERTAERQWAEQVQEAIYHISEAAQAAQNLEELYGRLHAIIGRLMPARNFYIALYDAPSGIISFPYYADELDAPPPPTKMRRGLTDYVLRTGEPLLATPQVVEELERSGEVELLGSPSVDWLGVPLKTQRGDAIGAMTVQSYNETIRFGEEDKEILIFVSSQVAMVIERKQAEEALQESEERYRRLVENAPLGILSADPQGRIVAVNPALLAMMGSPSVEATRQINMLTFPPLVEAGIAGDIRRCLESGNAVTSERLYTSKWGKTCFMRLHLTPIVDNDGQVSFVQVVAEDISERKQAEEEREKLRVQVAQSQKMEAVGRLAGGIAHDFNNMLAVITGYSQLVLKRLRPGDPLSEDMREILNAADRAASLTRQLLAFGRKQVLQKQALDLGTHIANAEKMLRRLIAEDIELAAVLAEDLKPVRADPGQMDQIIMNLVVNACAAMPQGGRLTIKAENVVVDEEQCRSMPAARPGRFVRLSVADTGSGMDEQVLEHIFEPFFTTKEDGTGLGLAVVYGIVRQHDGWITVDSKPGQGSVFEIYLPALAEATPADREAPLPAPLPQGRGEQILLVEDDEGVRRLTRRILEGNGYQVLEAASAGEGLEILQREGTGVDLVFSDVVLPDGTALEFMDQIRALQEGLPVVLSSGYADEKPQWASIHERGYRFLQKPYSLASLLATVRAALD